VPASSSFSLFSFKFLKYSYNVSIGISTFSFLDEKLDAMLSHDDVTDDCIDDIVSDLQNIFVNAAKYTFGYTSNEQRSTDLNKNPWFDNICKEKRDDLI
jgi:hypothetical protein